MQKTTTCNRRHRHRRLRIAVGVACLLMFSNIEAAPGATAKSAGHRGRNARQVTRKRLVTRASWYGQHFARRKTASGRPYNPRDLTGAHRTIPLGSDVRVTNLENGHSVVVRITDRGPYVSGRGIDLSIEAARRLHMIDRGVAEVEIEVLPKVDSRPPTPIALAAGPTELPWGRGIVR